MGERAEIGSGSLPARAWRRGQAGWPARYPVVQFPNPPLLVAIVGRILCTSRSATARSAGPALFIVGLTVWAWNEAARGENLLRRILGLTTLVRIVQRLRRLAQADRATE